MTLLRIFSLIFLLFLSACTPKLEALKDHPVRGHLQYDRHYSLAIYNQENRLISYPLEELRKHARSKTSPPDISDIYIVAHGWNFTIPEALNNFNTYIEYIDEVMEEAKKNAKLSKDFHPYFIFVTWHSIVRPLSEITSATLPFGLDEATNILTKPIDAVVFQIPTAWKQSVNAFRIGKGGMRSTWVLPDNVYDLPSKSISTFDSKEQGRPVPLSMVLYRLLTDNANRELGSQLPPKVHIIGHSYGGKLVISAVMGTLNRLALGSKNSLLILDKLGINPIESLVLINPAINPQEIIVSGKNPSLLRSIPRKAILYSNYDYPNGSFYSLSQFLINGAWANMGDETSRIYDLFGKIHYRFDEVGQDVSFNESGDRRIGEELKVFYNNPIFKLINGLYILAWMPVYSVIDWTFSTLMDLPYDFVYHLKANDTFDVMNNYVPGIKFPLNALHFFLPVDQLYPWNGHSDKQGLFRPTKSALGRTGLNRWFYGREFFDDRLEGFIDSHTDINAEKFCQLAIELGTSSEPTEISNERIYSFDASDVYNSWGDPLVGAHGDLNSQDPVKCAGKELEKREFTFNFLFNFTKKFDTVQSPNSVPINILP